MNSKRGLSDLIGTVLIIVIVIAALIPISFFLINFVRDKTVSLSDLDLSLKNIEAYHNNEPLPSNILNSQESMETVYVSLERGSDKTNLTGLKFVFTVGGNSHSCIRQSVPQVSETSIYAFKSDIFNNELDSIVVVPIITIGNSERSVGSGYSAKIFNTTKTFTEKINECGGFCCNDDDMPDNPNIP